MRWIFLRNAMKCGDFFSPYSSHFLDLPQKTKAWIFVRKSVNFVVVRNAVICSELHFFSPHSPHSPHFLHYFATKVDASNFFVRHSVKCGELIFYNASIFVGNAVNFVVSFWKNCGKFFFTAITAFVTKIHCTHRIFFLQKFTQKPRPGIILSDLLSRTFV